MAEKRTPREPSTTGVGPGVTGASGDLIEGTGGDQGIGGTGEAAISDAAAQRPDERQNPGPQDLGNARPDGEGTGGLPEGDVLSDVPGGTRNVGPANDRDTSGAKAHRGSERTEPQEQDTQGPREGGRER